VKERNCELDPKVFLTDAVIFPLIKMKKVVTGI